ncbi:hypothetical protein HMPREF9093_00331 [Fusobacterium sp. oral taxon 370 str. F0437]|nr:hypothetical protein HMPREF9093_00331 [Fusobacterium sp. oral taxon 370 str. F0437]
MRLNNKIKELITNELQPKSWIQDRNCSSILFYQHHLLYNQKLFFR